VQELPDTRDSLLLQIREPENRLAWEEFVEIYRPVIYRTATARGLQHADAMDLVQTVFIAVAGSIANWEKRNENSRFRHWLLRIARNATINAITRQPPDRPVGGGLPAEDQVIETESASQLDLEYRRQLYLRAAEQVRGKVDENTWQAFELTALQGMAIEETARELGKSPGAVYAARSRIMKQLASLVSKLEESYQ
jgi:RNA polymerase sigma-70 factor (ECF subfamily)